ncbi:hypothetical protein [Sphingomonas abietis]|uniref:DUF3040 domain-containing protein n=1 Tax=Sphingomonas abietis TaxID=3012344 RepID=A0ABY7NMN9_9SPHN|nr:hypothetical protein [Sphingomonas abietis]WBO21751.1 hypothetical protein PBT88_16495 [Sphingomonas abietis]
MTRGQTKAHPDQLQLGWSDEDARIESLVEERLAARFEAESFIWRFRLVAIETVMMGMLVLVAGLLLKQPTLMVLRATLLVAASCFATGLLLLSLSAGTAKLLSRLKAWRRR